MGSSSPWNGGSEVAIYQCLFYSRGLIGYWENVAASTDQAARARLVAEMSDGEWQSAEAWLGDQLACQIELSMLAPKAPAQELLALH
jgi:hypothetical protein